MRHIPRNVGLILLLTLIIGCNTAPKRYAVALVTLDNVNKAFIASANAGLITDKQIVASEPLFKAADAQVKILGDEMKAGGTINSTALKSLEGILDAIQTWLAQAREKH